MNWSTKFTHKGLLCSAIIFCERNRKDSDPENMLRLCLICFGLQDVTSLIEENPQIVVNIVMNGILKVSVLKHLGVELVQQLGIFFNPLLAALVHGPRCTDCNIIVLIVSEAMLYSFYLASVLLCMSIASL